MNKRIIVAGRPGLGASQLAALVAAGSGLPVVEEWDGRTELPGQCIAVVTVDDEDDVDDYDVPSGAFFVVALGNEVESVELPSPVAEITVTGNISDLKKSILAGA